ncbi:MAG TPA: M2 family metallopeptidase [Longimicrobiaceae bacterium]|nr:M2 family metallopeptidase [Longimicrobiaceae bacterium]
MTGIEQSAREWVDAHVAAVAPLERAAGLAGWEAATTGSEEALARSSESRAAVRRIYSDPAAAARVRGFLASPELRDPLLRRELQRLDLLYTGNQLPPETLEELTRRETGLEQIFYTFRPLFEGREVSNNELLDVLREETDSARRRAAWEAAKEVGERAAEPLRELVRVRNAAARSLGFENYYAMDLALQELDEPTLFGILDAFREETDAAFATLRGEMDLGLAGRFGLGPAELRPWHWEDFFSQEAPAIGEVNLDRLFHGRNLPALAREYYASIALPADDILARSDLYERENKDQHAFCTDIDREGDVRTLCNLRDNERSMSTLLHELGHGVYDKFIPRELPYPVRCAAHTMTTEAVAMFMGRLTRNPEWLREALGATIGAPEAEDIRRQLRLSMLVSARWILVMSYFERELYRDPDRADLNTLWWDLVESIQRVRRPEGRDAPDWASKMHLSMSPVYYHNYLLGEMTASQLGAAIRARTGGGTAYTSREVGRFLRERVFSRGAVLPWNELMEEATGEPLSPRYFVEEFV